MLMIVAYSLNMYTCDYDNHFLNKFLVFETDTDFTFCKIIHNYNLYI